MGKQGPCYHCGVTSTPLWRNGPPDKPVLCNACGSRWRTKGTLTNYTPLHSRGEAIESDVSNFPKVKNPSLKLKEDKLHKRKQNDIIEEAKGEEAGFALYRRGLEEDTSTRSSSGSAISYSESCVQFASTDAKDIRGSAQSNAWDSLIPSRKRTCVNRQKPSSVEKLTKELYCILHEQELSYLSGTSEEDLLFETTTPMVSVEIGHGGVLIRPPNSLAQEEESEASSLLTESKAHFLNDDCSRSTSHHVNIPSKGCNFSEVGDGIVKTNIGEPIQEDSQRNKTSDDECDILWSSNSPLISIDLKDVINFEEFTRHLVHEEKLTSYLTSVDTNQLPESLKRMFDSHQFQETLSSFQQLLSEGIFDNSFSGENIWEFKILKKLVLNDMVKARWVEQYKLHKVPKGKQIRREKGVPSAFRFPDCHDAVELKTNHDGPCRQKFPKPKSLMKLPKRLPRNGSITLPSIKSQPANSNDISDKASCYNKEQTPNYGHCFSPKSLFATSSPDRNSMLDAMHGLVDDPELMLGFP
ncbi:GATA transcription factor 26 [Amborella trichopoda]|uniref:Uncharacterized protein n=1 Tax=Amborella trichopoda TaxID=13333 RepID=W1P2B3_AMBTC|nr:GATA transcription factor 26 [Amborella trichopoda]ERN01095.1 hypothetical protein AMTR_s00002p00191340 [Amborella trichopoda]|eukprot:XP_006838526.1 GATA transcription factor 26 [Amborella trichopoda]